MDWSSCVTSVSSAIIYENYCPQPPQKRDEFDIWKDDFLRMVNDRRSNQNNQEKRYWYIVSFISATIFLFVALNLFIYQLLQFLLAIRY